MEHLLSTVGQSAEFNIALISHRVVDNSCFNQSIQVVTLLKNGSPIVKCSNTSCLSHDPRVNVSRFMGTFNITVILHNLNTSDSGTYVAIADIRRPSNNQ